MTSPLLDLVAAFEGVPVVVVGDLMLDRYVWGDVSRISPEAPIPVLRVAREEARLGGAGSVIANVAVLGARVRAVAAIGNDPAGDAVLSLLSARGVDARDVLRVEGPTTQKSRLVARTQQLLRLDHDGSPLGPGIEAALTARAVAALDGARAVLVSDYGRGVLAGELCTTLAREARRRGIPILADPNRDAPFERYRGVAAITPNRGETARATGIEPRDEDACREAARRLISRLELDFVAITLDKDGIYLLERGAERGRRFPARARQVYDVAGAGDMVLAVLGLCQAVRAELADSVQLANVAGGLEVERLGVTPITPDELRAELRGAPPAWRRKVVADFAQATNRVEEARRAGKRVVLTNGCFDLLHAGHAEYLQACRDQGSYLVVGLNTDASVRGLKGPSRPVLPLAERATLLAALESVDLVVPFDEPTPQALVERVRPDVLCKGEDYRDKLVVGRDLVEGYGGRVELIPLRPGVSTTSIIDRISGQEPR